jgi:hypothetical protein
VRILGAHHVIDHSKPLIRNMHRRPGRSADYVISLTHTDQHFDQALVEASSRRASWR